MAQFQNVRNRQAPFCPWPVPPLRRCAMCFELRFELRFYLLSLLKFLPRVASRLIGLIGLIGLVLGLTGSAYAARPMITDDARLVDEKSCQLESWSKFYQRGGWERWALPSCNPTGNLEITAGGAYSHPQDGGHASDVVFQAKTLFRPLTPDNWGYGLAVGTVRHPSIQTELQYGDQYAYIPMSFAFGGDDFLLHLNAGAVRRPLEHATFATWGIGSETRLNSRLQLIAESYGDSKSRGFYHVGLRFWLVPDRVQLDTTYGNRWASETGERWLSIGLRLISPAFLP